MRPSVYCAERGCSERVRRGPCRRHARERERARPNFDVRSWYHCARWEALKAQVRREQPLCDDCEREGMTVSGTQTDHTIPHQGDPDLFWNRGNLRNKCARHHARKTRAGL